MDCLLGAGTALNASHTFSKLLLSTPGLVPTLVPLFKVEET